MIDKSKRVTLQAGNAIQKFEISHAERILMMPRNGGWHLPTNSEYELTKNGLTFKSDKGINKKP